MVLNFYNVPKVNLKRHGLVWFLPNCWELQPISEFESPSLRDDVTGTQLPRDVLGGRKGDRNGFTDFWKPDKGFWINPQIHKSADLRGEPSAEGIE